MKLHPFQLAYYRNVPSSIFKNRFFTFKIVSTIGLTVFSLAIQGFRIFKYNEIPFTTPDSNSYFNLKFLGAQRPPLVPLIYTTLKDPILILGFQCLLSTFSYIFFYSVLLRLNRNSKKFNFLILIGFTFFLASSPTYEHNFFLMSESITISTSTLLLSSFFLFLSNKTTFNAYLISIFYILLFYGALKHCICNV